MIEWRYVLRALFNNRAVAVIAIVCLAIAIRGNTAIYTSAFRYRLWDRKPHQIMPVLDLFVSDCGVALTVEAA